MVIKQDTNYKKINNCKNCNGYGKIQDFVAEDNIQIIDCPVCKGKPKKSKLSEGNEK